MTSGLFLFTLLTASCLVVLVSSYDQTKSVIPLIQNPGSARQERDLLLSDDDDDYEFFSQQSLSEQKTTAGKSALAQLGFPHHHQQQPQPEDSGEVPPERVSALMAKLQSKSGQFFNVAQEVAVSAVNLLIAFGRLAEHSKDKFIVLAK